MRASLPTLQRLLPARRSGPEPARRSVAVPKDQLPVQPWSQQSLPTWLLSAGVGHAVWTEMIVSTSVSVVLHVLNVHGQLLAGVK